MKNSPIKNKLWIEIVFVVIVAILGAIEVGVWIWCCNKHSHEKLGPKGMDGFKML